MNKENLTESGFEPETSGLTYQRSTNWAIQPYVGGSPNCQLSFVQGDKLRKNRKLTGYNFKSISDEIVNYLWQFGGPPT